MFFCQASHIFGQAQRAWVRPFWQAPHGKLFSGLLYILGFLKTEENELIVYSELWPCRDEFGSGPAHPGNHNLQMTFSCDLWHDEVDTNQVSKVNRRLKELLKHNIISVYPDEFDKIIILDRHIIYIFQEHRGMDCIWGYFSSWEGILLICISNLNCTSTKTEKLEDVQDHKIYTLNTEIILQVPNTMYQWRICSHNFVPSLSPNH